MYAHGEADMRKPQDHPTPAPEKYVDPTKVVVPFATFPGANDEERQTAAYKAVLGVGASHIRFMMQKTGCRLQLRGVGCGGADSKEPLYIQVRPGIDGKAPTAEQMAFVRRVVDEIVKDGKPSDMEPPAKKPAVSGAAEARPAAGGAAAAPEGKEGPPPKKGAEGAQAAEGRREEAQEAAAEAPPKAEAAGDPPGGGADEAAEEKRRAAAEPCGLGAACPDLACALRHPRLPGLTPPPGEKAKMKFFVVRSRSIANIQVSIRAGMWATTRQNTQVLKEAWERSDHVVLIFSAGSSGHFHGYGRMTSAPDRDLNCQWRGMSSKLGDNFKVSWLKQCLLPYSQTDALRSGPGGPLKSSRDGQEVPSALGSELARLMYQQRDE
ncbi:unnamed protein product, partial [Prorocentrum cordatum]